jgi:HK97 family phage major capsid protein
MMHLLDMKRQRRAALDAADVLLNKAKDEKRELTAEESRVLETHMDTVSALNPKIKKIEDMNTIKYLLDPETGTPRWVHDPEAAKNNPQIPGVNGGASRLMNDLAMFYRGQEILASDSPLFVGSGGLSSTIPTQILAGLPTYATNDAFARAGATIYGTNDTNPLVKPIISAGAAPDTYGEGESSTDSHPMQVDSFTFGGTKYSRLVKASMEALMNSSLDLPGEITNELTVSVVNGFTAAISTAMMSALDGNPACFVESGSEDPYYSLNALINAVPVRFDSPQNAFMGSRASRLLISNARDMYGRPLFDPVTNTVLNHPYIVNDNLSRVVYGNWASGAFVRKSPFFLQRLIEAYASSGEEGFRATQFLDSKFLASVSAVTVQPLYFTHLDAAGS